MTTRRLWCSWPIGAKGRWAVLWLVAGCGPSIDSPPPTEPAPKAIPLAFTDVTMALGLPQTTSDCAAFRDLDDDGRPDILVSPTDVNGQSNGQLVAFRNLGDGTFNRIAVPTSLQSVGPCEVVDVDGDGHTDIVIADSPWNGGDKFLVLRGMSTPDLQFVEQPFGVTKIAALHEFGFFDYDNDGLLDLVEAPFNLQGLGPNVDHCDASDDDYQCYLKPGTNVPAAPLVLHGAGGGKFEMSSLAGIAGQCNALAFIDFDADGFVDLFQAGDFGVNHLLRNVAGRSLLDVLPSLNAAPYNHGMGAAFADFNRDQLWDFYSADIGPDQLYLGQSGGGLMNATRSVGLIETTRFHSAWAPLAEDFNNDSWTDLYLLNTALVSNLDELKSMVANDVANTQAMQEDFALASQGGTSFVNTIVPHRDLHHAPVAQGAAAEADYDGDGKRDVLVVAGDRGELRLLHNVTDTASWHWLDVRLVPSKGNTAGRGAVVIVRDGGREIGRRAVGVEGHRIDSTLDAHFGLGPHTSVQVSVRWPGGVTQDLSGSVQIDAVLVVKEP